MDSKSLAAQPQSLEIIILEAISKGKKNASKPQWFVVGQSVVHQLVSPCDSRNSSMAVPHQGLDSCFDPQTIRRWLVSKQRGAAGELPWRSYMTYTEGGGGVLGGVHIPTDLTER